MSYFVDRKGRLDEHPEDTKRDADRLRRDPVHRFDHPRPVHQLKRPATSASVLTLEQLQPTGPTLPEYAQVEGRLCAQAHQRTVDAESALGQEQRWREEARLELHATVVEGQRIVHGKRMRETPGGQEDAGTRQVAWEEEEGAHGSQWQDSREEEEEGIGCR